MPTLSQIELPNGTTYDIIDTTYTAGNGLTLTGTSFNVGKRWIAVTQGQKWSRLYFAEPVTATVGTSGLLSVACTRGSVVCNATFLITTSHAGATYSTCQELASCNYTQVRSRLVVASDSKYYFEVYDTAASIASGTTQNWRCCFVPLCDTTLTTYTVFTDGTTVPSGYTATNDFTTTGGNAASAIKAISRSGTTFTATRQDGSTFTFTQQDNNTTYSLSQDSSDGHKITLTPSSGSAQTVTIPDNNTTYTFANGTNGFTVTPSGGTAQPVTVTPSITNNVTGNAAWTAADVITITNASSGNVIKASGKTIATSITNVDTTVPTSKAVKTYVDGLVANATHFKGGFAASGDGAIDGGSTTLKSVAEAVGDLYTCTTAGTIYGIVFEVGDSIIFKTTVAAGTAPTSASFITVEGETSVSVVDNNPTLSWGAKSKVATIEGTEINVTMPSNPNTDTMVTQTATSTSANYEILFSGTADNTTRTEGARKYSNLTFNPSTGNLTATKFNNYTLGAACAKGVVTSVDTSASLPTSNAVKTFVEGKGYVTTDTKNTAGTDDTSSKIYLVGSLTQSAVNADGTARTYTDNEVYVTSGVLQTKNAQATAVVAANTANSSTAGGLSLYGTAPTDYGIAFRGTGNGGKHGYVQGDWAQYHYMTGADNRGWVFNSAASTGVASISKTGNAVFNGSVTVGGNAANTSGCRLEFDTSVQALNFVFT